MNEPIPSTTSTAATLPPPIPARRKWWKSALVLMLVFGCGIGVGIVGTIRVALHHLEEAIQHPERMSAKVADRLDRRLGLNPEQHREVQTILERRQKQLLAIRHDVQPKVEVVLDGVESDISAVLNPGQREKWLSQVHDLRKRFTPPMPKE